MKNTQVLNFPKNEKKKKEKNVNKGKFVKRMYSWKYFKYFT